VKSSAHVTELGDQNEQILNLFWITIAFLSSPEIETRERIAFLGGTIEGKDCTHERHEIIKILWQ
jgi:hypothetical protein